MSDSQGDSGPPLLRPIPRRPFDLNLREPTPPEDEYSPSISTSSHVPLALNLERLNSRLLDPRDSSHASSYSYSPNEPSSASISRAQSSLNLTGSTLSGIYSPSTYGKDRFGDMLASPVGTGTGTPTPWGTGAETPAKGLVRDDDPRIYEIQKERAQPPAAKKHRRRSSLHPNAGAKPLSTAQMVLHFGSRGMLMFGLGALYGMLVKTLHDRHRGQGQNHMDSYDARYMAFWGMSGVAMGCLLPWFDGIWERAFGQDEEVVEESESMGAGGEGVEKQPQSCTDWALAIRGIGAFVGIAFAIVSFSFSIPLSPLTLNISLTTHSANSRGTLRSKSRSHSHSSTPCSGSSSTDPSRDSHYRPSWACSGQPC